MKCFKKKNPRGASKRGDKAVPTIDTQYRDVYYNRKLRQAQWEDPLQGERDGPSPEIGSAVFIKLMLVSAALPCLALPCLASPRLALPCLALPYLALPRLALPCLARFD